MAGNAADNCQNPIDFFRIKAAEAAGVSYRANMMRAVDSFAEFAGSPGLDFNDFSAHTVGEWVARLFSCGYAPKTVAAAVKRLGSLFSKAVEAGLAQPSDAFSAMLARLNGPAARRFDGAVDKDSLAKVQKIIMADRSGSPQKQLAKDVLLFAVLDGGLSFSEIASYKKDDYKGFDERLLEIVARYSRPKNKYLFPLDQNHSTPRQMTRRLELLMADALSGCGLRLSAVAADTPLCLWCACAIGCGVPAADIAACVAPRVGASPITAFVSPSRLDAETVADIRLQVAETLADNPPRWYAMHLRRNVDPDTVLSRLKDNGIELTDIYYPMEEIARKVGHRKVFESRPVVAWLLFFRVPVTDLGRIFRHIGDLAWGYRASREPGSPYTPISNSDIWQYQAAIGTLTPDVHILPDSDIQFQKGDSLIVLGGVFNGRHAIFDSLISTSANTSANAAAPKTVCRIILDGGLSANWVIDWDPRLIRKLPAS